MLTAGEKWAGAANAPARSGLAFSSTICFPVSSFTYFYFQYSVLSFSSHCFPSQQDFNRLHYAALLMASLLIYALSLNWRLFCINGLMSPHKLPDKEKKIIIKSCARVLEEKTFSSTEGSISGAVIG